MVQMSTRKMGAVLTALAASLAIAAPASGSGPQAEIGDPAVVACLGADLTGGGVGRQIEAGIPARGGPKAIDGAPAHCDHIWQTSRDGGGAGAIRNADWPPPPLG